MKVVLNIYKTLRRPHIEYRNLAWLLSLDMGIGVNIEIGGYAKKNENTNKKCKKLQLLGELGLTSLPERKMRGSLVETFKMINGIFDYGRHFIKSL